MLHTVVMAGGSGTRFWPQSRKALPKQLLKLVGDHTMIQDTVTRCAQLTPHQRIWVVTNQSLAEETSRQLPQVPWEQILIEPAPRNTAPCIGLAAIQLLKNDPDATMLVVSSDHIIQPTAGFVETVNQATAQIKVQPDSLVLIGVTPTRPATGYGYIQCGAALGITDANAFQVEEFKEKPDVATAQSYCDSGNYLWNCGIFAWKARTILDALAQYEPEMYEQLQQIADSIGTPEYKTVLAEVFPQMKSESIDYAVLEHAKQNLAVIPAEFEWDDVGNWNTLQKYYPADENGNTIVGLHAGLQSSDNIIVSTDDHLIATFGMEYCLIVHTPDATLIAPKQNEAAIKELVNQLEARGYDRFL